jgi:hypothetical protein
MVICPMCEHAQEPGGECILCGRRLLDVGASDEPIPRMGDLDPTRLEISVAPSMDRIEGLEPTLLDVPAAAAPEEPPPWIERTARDPVAAEALEPLAIERTCSAREDAPPRDLLELPICRYCRTPASPGEVFCARCGLKVDVYTGGTGGSVNSHADVRRCRFCGAAATGEACPSCGTRFAVET